MPGPTALLPCPEPARQNPHRQDALISLLKQPGSAQHFYRRPAPGTAHQSAAAQLGTSSPGDPFFNEIAVAHTGSLNGPGKTFQTARVS
jgi:hypothetical protein